MDQPVKRTLRWSLLCIICLALACEKTEEVEPIANGNNGVNNSNNDSTASLSPNEFSELLVLNNAVQKQGAAPGSSNGNLLINIKDSIFILTGSAGSLIQIKHDPTQNIKGMYVYVKGADHYYDVPVSDTEGIDSIAAIYINIDLESALGKMTHILQIKPYDDSNNVVDEFERTVTIEEPGECNNIQSAIIDKDWIWMYTYFVNNYSSEITGIRSPVHYSTSSYETGGCCEDGHSYYHPSLCPVGSPIYKSLMVYGQYLRSTEEVLKFVGDEFLRTLATEINNYNPDKSDFCKGIAGYDFVEEICGYLGTYSFPSCGEINFITTVYEHDEEGYPTCGWVRDGRYIIEVSEDGHIMILRRFDGETTWANWVYYSLKSGLVNPLHWFE